MWQPSRQTNQQTKVQLSKSSSKVFKTPEAPGDFWLWDKFLTFWEPVATHQVMKILFQAGLGPKNLEDFLDAKICPIMLSGEQKATKIEWFFFKFHWRCFYVKSDKSKNIFLHDLFTCLVLQLLWFVLSPLMWCQLQLVHFFDDNMRLVFMFWLLLASFCSLPWFVKQTKNEKKSVGREEEKPPLLKSYFNSIEFPNLGWNVASF